VTALTARDVRSWVCGEVAAAPGAHAEGPASVALVDHYAA
jgi:hypothetical protein